MQALSCVADDDAAPGAGTRRLRQRQRIRDTSAHFEKASESESESALQLGEELGIGAGHHGIEVCAVYRQHESASAVRQRQQRERTASRESLVGHVVMKSLR